MPSDITTTRRKVKSRISQILNTYGVELTECGGKTETVSKPVSPETGYWEDLSVSNKPTRLILHLIPDATGQLTARLPEVPQSGRFAFANTANRPVAALLVRIVPAIKLDDDRYEFYQAWEWLLWYCFSPALKPGSSGQLFDGFNPAAGTFTYLDEIQPYIAAGLVTLCEEADTYTPPADSGHAAITYRDATAAIRDLIHVNVKSEPPEAPPPA